MIRHQQQKGSTQIFPCLEHRKAVFSFPVLVNNRGDTNSQTVGQTVQKVLNAPPLVSGNYIKVIHSGLQAGVDDPFNQGNP